MSTTAQNEILVTEEGLKKLKEELEYLQTTKKKEVAQRLKEAISYGDLSENSEYEEAKNEQAFTAGRILELEKKIKNAKVISGNKGKTSKKIQIASKVTIENTADKSDKNTYTIVGATEADPLNNKISNESPIGAALIGKAKGDTISVDVPAGLLEYKIVDAK